MRSKVSQFQHEIKAFHNKAACFLDAHASVHEWLKDSFISRLWQRKAVHKNNLFLFKVLFCVYWLGSVCAFSGLWQSRSHLCDPQRASFLQLQDHQDRLLACKSDWNKCLITSAALRPKVLHTTTKKEKKTSLLPHPNSFPLSLMFLKWAFQLHIFLAIQFYKAIIPGVMWRLNISGQTLCENN